MYQKVHNYEMTNIANVAGILVERTYIDSVASRSRIVGGRDLGILALLVRGIQNGGRATGV